MARFVRAEKVTVTSKGRLLLPILLLLWKGRTTKTPGRPRAEILWLSQNPMKVHLKQ